MSYNYQQPNTIHSVISLFHKNKCHCVCSPLLLQNYQMLFKTQENCERCRQDILYLNQILNLFNVDKKMENFQLKNIDDNNHEFNCQCTDCRNKFGSLPLLLEVIEAQETQQANQVMESHQHNRPLTDPVAASTSTHSKSNKKEINCTLCAKTFTHKGDFNKHLRMHSGEKPYMCDLCKRQFSHTSNLNRHLKVHSGLKPFQCDNCSKEFSRKDKLELHKTTNICKKRSKKNTTNTD